MHVSKVYATYIYIKNNIKIRTHLTFMVIHQQSRDIQDLTEGIPYKKDFYINPKE